jgi:flagellar motor switch/type III secretory pathway protein FliN
MDKEETNEFDFLATDAGTADDSRAADDDWAAAMAEQAQADATPAAGAQAANIFPSFDEPGNKASLMNELDMILDIPVQIAVELGRTKSPSRTCCNWRTARSSNSTPWPANR